MTTKREVKRALARWAKDFREYIDYKWSDDMGAQFNQGSGEKWLNVNLAMYAIRDLIELHYENDSREIATVNLFEAIYYQMAARHMMVGRKHKPLHLHKKDLYENREFWRKRKL